MSFDTIRFKKDWEKKVIIGALYIIERLLTFIKRQQFVCYPQ